MLLVATAAGALITAVVAVLRPDLPTRLPAIAMWVGPAIGAMVAGLADTEPTGSNAVDLVLRIAFGALVPLAASKAGTLATCWLLVMSTATMLVAFDAPGGAGAALLAGAFLALAAAGSASAASASIVVGASIGALAHVDWPVATGASALAVAVATAPVLLTGLARTRRPWRGRIVLAASLAGVALVVAAVGGVVAALGARADVDRAVEFATSGIDRLGDDDERARSDLLDAAGAFDSAQDDLTVWWARPALLVPGVAQQSRAVTTMASAGSDLARTAADATEDADVDSVRPRNGRVDIRALVALREPLDRSLGSLRRADARLDGVESPLLLGPLAERLDTLRTEVTDALGSAELAAHAVDVAPELLGASGPRRYLIAFQNPAELTGNGGFFGNWAELVTDDGQMTLTRSGRNRDLSSGGPDPLARHIENQPEYVSIYGQSGAQLWGNINFTPDHPTTSEIMAQLYPESGGEPVDGVVAITPGAMAGFLELTGPVQVEGYPEALTSENVERVLLHDQYVQFAQEEGEERESFLSEAVEAVFDQLTSGELPGPGAIAAELGPAVASRELQLWSRHGDEQALFDRIGATGDVSANGIDTFGVVTQNFNGNKIDWFLHRDVTYDLDWQPMTGIVEGTITAEIRNDAPASGLPASVIGWGGDPGTSQRPVADGENFMWVTMYSSHQIARITVDGAEVAFRATPELGHQTGRFHLSVPSKSVRTVVAHVRGVVVPSTRYSLRALRQATANPDSLAARVQVDEGWTLTAASGSETLDGGKQALSRQDATIPFTLTVDAARSTGRRTWVERVRGTS